MEFGPAFSADGKLQAVGRDQQGKDSSMLNLLPFPGAPSTYISGLTFTVLNSLAQSSLRFSRLVIHVFNITLNLTDELS